ncbi:hypothetical protein BOX15_Mlig030489g2, partial [Macrostomum lignano]
QRRSQQETQREGFPKQKSVLLSCAQHSVRPSLSKLADALAVQRCMVEQLRVEAGLNRLSVSQTVAELIKYCEDRSADDMLINGFTKQTENPFKEKGGCVAL